MKKTGIIILALIMLTLVPMAVAVPKPDINTITKGEVLYSSTHYLADTPIPTGFDIFGYNYQGHMFKGYYCNAYLGGAGLAPYTGNLDDYPTDDLSAFATHWTYPYRDINLVMKWNDAWLSNVDADLDGKLDRPADYIGSGAWETNHMWGINEDGTHWNYFTKIVAVPEDATESDGIWYLPDGTELGVSIWGSFATIFEVSNDPMYGDHGVIYNPPSPTGFGYYMP